MKRFNITYNKWAILLLCCIITGCKIENDIPFPIVEGIITAFEVEGMCSEDGMSEGKATIDKNNKKIDLYVDDTVDINQLRITRFEVSADATIIPMEGACINPERFPETGFTTTGDLDTRVNFGTPVTFTLRTYQDYLWTVNVSQIINREVEVENQVGEAIIDPVNHTVIVYVSKTQDLRTIKIKKLSIAGQHGSVIPNPADSEYTDFSKGPVTFFTSNAWSEYSYKWTVFVYQTDAKMDVTAQAFGRTVSATISGTKPNSEDAVVQYKVQGESTWTTLPSSQITASGTNYVAQLKGLKAGSVYSYKVSAGNVSTSEAQFTTTKALQLENNSFDEWSTTGSGTQTLYQPWAEGRASFWDTGNRGATTVGASNSTYVTEGNRTFANLQSKYIVIKFAAGNIFTGTYVETDGTNGVLGFGRPFAAFPSKLTFEYRYNSSEITRTGGAWNNAYSDYISQSLYEGLKGKPDSCQVYIALLGDKDEEEYKGTTYPYVIRTRPSTLHLFNPNNDNIIAYGQMTQGNTVSEWKKETITLNYRHTNRVPKYIVVVASSSKYGDYFCGGEASLLQIDNLVLEYE